MLIWKLARHWLPRNRHSSKLPWIEYECWLDSKHCDSFIGSFTKSVITKKNNITIWTKQRAPLNGRFLVIRHHGCRAHLPGHSSSKQLNKYNPTLLFNHVCSYDTMTSLHITMHFHFYLLVTMSPFIKNITVPISFRLGSKLLINTLLGPGILINILFVKFQSEK